MYDWDLKGSGQSNKFKQLLTDLDIENIPLNAGIIARIKVGNGNQLMVSNY